MPIKFHILSVINSLPTNLIIKTTMIMMRILHLHQKKKIAGTSKTKPKKLSIATKQRELRREKKR